MDTTSRLELEFKMSFTLNYVMQISCSAIKLQGLVFCHYNYRGKCSGGWTRTSKPYGGRLWRIEPDSNQCLKPRTFTSRRCMLPITPSIHSLLRLLFRHARLNFRSGGYCPRLTHLMVPPPRIELGFANSVVYCVVLQRQRMVPSFPAPLP